VKEMVEPEFYLNKINRVRDPENMTDLEKKHVPIIHVESTVELGKPFEVTVNVGELLAHPNMLGHWIGCISLYAGDVGLGRITFAPGVAEPVLEMMVVLSEAGGWTKGDVTLRAVECCNLHGVWENTKTIKLV